MPGKPYNPLDKKNLGVSVAEALLQQSTKPLALEASFLGAGIYAIYYVGDFPPYERIASRNQRGQFELPIYAGRAIPPVARKGGFGLDTEPGTVVQRQLLFPAGDNYFSRFDKSLESLALFA